MIAALTAVILVGTSFLAGFDLFELMPIALEQIGRYSIHTLIIPVAMVSAGLLMDLATTKQRERREIEIQAQRLKVLKATMRTVHNIVNNSLNGLQLFRLEAEDTLPLESLELLDELVHETSVKLQALGDIEGTPEKTTAIGICIDYDSPAACGLLAMAA
jgi:hypothetical protein